MITKYAITLFFHFLFLLLRPLAAFKIVSSEEAV